MAVTTRLMQDLSPAAVFDVLRDGSTYAHWVVGTREVRRTDADWPRPGAVLHYTAGRGPLRKDDQTTSLAYEPDRRLELQARAWPMGSARIVIIAAAERDGVLVSIDEKPCEGLAALVHNPVLDLLIKVRNVETLRRLEDVVRERH